MTEMRLIEGVRSFAVQLRSHAKLGYRRSGVAYVVGLGALRGLILAPAEQTSGLPDKSLPT